MKKITALIMICVFMVSLFGCDKSSKTNDHLGKEVIAFSSQLDTLTQLKIGSIDCAIIDSVMAGYYTSMGEYKNDLMIIDDLILATEEYGIAAKKGNNSLIDKINEGLYLTNENKTLDNIGSFFGVTKSINKESISSYTSNNAIDDSWTNIVNNKKIIIGYTVFAPIAYEDSNNSYTKENKFTGFDVELSRAVIEALNNKYKTEIKIEFLEIEWNSKEALLENGSIDLVWNGLTITDERLENMCISNAYMNNFQVAVINKTESNKYNTKESLKSAIIGVESGSAGEDVALNK